MPKWLRSLLIVILALAVAGGGTYGILTILKNRSAGTVKVYAAEDLCTDYGGSNRSETEGAVTTDRIQSVYLSATQQVTEVYVTEGQEVKEGDPILAFDTTLSDLELERKRIEIEKLRLQLSEAQQERQAMDSYQVYSGSLSQPETPEEEALTPAPYMPWLRGGSGTAERPYVYLWNELCAYDSAFIDSILPAGKPVQPTAPPEGGETPPDSGETPPDSGETPPDSGETPPDSGETPPDSGGDAAPPVDSGAAAGDGMVPDVTPEPEQTPPPGAEPPADPKPQPGPEIYVVFEKREENSEEGMLLEVWQMVFWRAGDGSAVFTMGQPQPGYDEFLSGGSTGDGGYTEPGGYSGPAYTWSELQQMKADADQNIKDLKFQLKKAELEFEVVQYELSNGVVYSKIDGVVKTLRSPEAALADNEPVVLISGGGGYYVEAVMGELDLDYMQVGDKVEVMSWESGQTLEGEIVEISRFPRDDGRYAYYWSQGNNNISKYPFTVFLPEDAPLREHEYVNISFSRQSGESQSVYLENPFIRQENGKSYILAQGEDGRLEKRYVSTGASLWGSYTEILSGLDPETDYLAFPYGKGVAEGAQTETAGIDELYSIY